jgi:hypothetical protein
MEAKARRESQAKLFTKSPSSSLYALSHRRNRQVITELLWRLVRSPDNP